MNWTLFFFLRNNSKLPLRDLPWDSLKHTPKHTWNPKLLSECFKNVCPEPVRQRDTAHCSGLGSGLRLSNTIHYYLEPSKGRKSLWIWYKPLGSGSEPEKQPVPVSFTPVHKQKLQKQMSACLVRKEEEDVEGYSTAEPLWEQEEEVEVVSQ